MAQDKGAGKARKSVAKKAGKKRPVGLHPGGTGKKGDSKLTRASASLNTRSRGAHVIGATEAQNNFGRILDIAQSRPVIVQKFNRPAAVVISSQLYESLRGGIAAAGSADLQRLGERFDAMVAEMQTEGAQAGADRLFLASGKALGKAAHQAAKRQPNG
jgi:prevent-host-death family protein